ncbi:MAG: CRISPR-associated ring nuclease Csm6 [Geminicoccaceae bacterium]
MTPDPTRPETFPRRVLLCVVGLTPQVVTETLWALAVARRPPFAPTELQIVTTAKGAEWIELVLLSGRRMLDALARDHPGAGLDGLAERTTVHQVRGSDGAPLSDIASLEANTALADLLVEVVRNLTADPAAALHVSIAGGRKTMGFLAGYALSLFGRPQDRLSHVLVDPAFEQHPEFFWPPPEPVVLIGQGRDQKPIRTDRCNLVLADIPFVRLREGLPQDLLAGRASFQEAVDRLQERFRPAELVIDLPAARVRAHGREIACPPIECAFWAWLAERRLELGEAAAVRRDDRAALDRFLALYRRTAEPERVAKTRKALDDDPKGAWFSERVTRLNKLVERALGPVSPHYRVERVGRRSASAWRLSTPPEAIRLILDATDESHA